MTAAGITRIISQLEARGSDGGVVVCPHCDGGTRKRRTLSIHNRDGVWLWLCHRGTCAAKGAVASTPRDAVKSRPKDLFQPSPLTIPLRLPEPGDPIAGRVKASIRRPLGDFALSTGLRVAEANPNLHVWLLRDASGRHFASQTRDEHKFVTTFREVDKPVYGFFRPFDRGEAHFSVIVEDPLSAALLAESSVNGIALCSTHLSPETARELRDCGLLGAYTFVALDPDSAGARAAGAVVDRLRSLGIKAAPWHLKADVKNYSLRDRENLIETMYEWTREVQP